MKFYKYHALGNDYLVVDPADQEVQLSPAHIRRICHRNFGIGSDGILLGPLPSTPCQFGLRIYNPDGSEAEKSGNGLRIFSRYLWDRRQVSGEEFTVETAGGVVRSQVQAGGQTVRVEMGQVSFESEKIPVAGPARPVLNEKIDVGGERFTFCAATIGNPHCVVPVEEPTPEMARRFGPLLEIHPMFPRRTNVQFMRVIDSKTIQIEIWERGAGYTLASGSSSSAAAAVAHRLGQCGDHITVRMPGGELLIEIGVDYAIRMTGPVTRVAEGILFEESFMGEE